MDFHKFYFDLGGSSGPSNTTMCSPMVHVLGGAAVVCYVRLVQKLDESGKPITARCEETRVWHHRGGRWQHVHFHRSVSV
jgi:calcium/calmodulin-dependent protein kinase (CaM kinase) II